MTVIDDPSKTSPTRPRRRALRLAVPALAAAASLALMGAQQGCSSGPAVGGGGEQRSTDCLARFSGFRLNGGPGWHAVGGVEVSCFQPFRSVRNTLTVQWRSTGAEWRNVGEADSTSSHDFPLRLFTSAHECHVGSWRLKWVVDAVAKDGTRMHDESGSGEEYETTCP